MNAYEERQDSKREYYESQAAKAHDESDSRYGAAKQLGECTPFGQPILVGHHSEGRHRRDIAKIDNNMRKSVEAMKKAEHYEQKAASVGTGGISSDDPEAIDKLNAKLKKLEKDHKEMKGINKIVKSKRKNYTDEQKLKDIAEKFPNIEGAEKMLEPDFCGRIGFPSYEMTNSNARMKQVKARIKTLASNAKKAEDGTAVKIVTDLYTLEECIEDNRLRFTFDGKPSDEIRTLLKSNGWRWSRHNEAWQRQLTGNGKYSARYVMGKLNEMKGGE